MCMMELATKTMTADSRIGSQSAVRGTMRSLLRLRGRMHGFPTREATLARSRGQEAGSCGDHGPGLCPLAWRAGPRPAPALCTSSPISLAVYLPRALSLERNGGTLIKFRHTALGLIPEDHRKGGAAGWGHIHERGRNRGLGVGPASFPHRKRVRYRWANRPPGLNRMKPHRSSD